MIYFPAEGKIMNAGANLIDGENFYFYTFESLQPRNTCQANLRKEWMSWKSVLRI